ncbi:MAG: hypothetical protein WBM07_13205 [Chitinivibrionales bacterium]
MNISTNQDALNVRRALKTYRRGHVSSLVLMFIGKAACFLLGALIIFQLVFALMPWTLLPVLWDGSIVAFGVAALFFFLSKCVVHKPTLRDIAVLAEKKAGFPHPWLSLAMELDGTATPGSTELKDDVMRRARESLAQCPRTIGSSMPRRWAFAVVALAAAWAITFGAIEPRCAEFWKLPLSFGATLKVRIFPGTVSVPMHSSITLRCAPPAGIFPSCRIFLAGQNDGFERTSLLRPDSSGSFSIRQDSLTASFCYRFALGNTTFAPETIRVIPVPSIFSLNILLKPPGYIGMAPALLQEGQGNFIAYAGSRANFSLIATGGLKSAALYSSNGDTMALTVRGANAEGELKIQRKCSYTFRLVDTLAQVNDSLPGYFVDIIPDMPPMVRILRPGKNAALTTALKETLWVEAIDDIGLMRCGLGWRKNSEAKDTTHWRDLMLGGRGEKTIRRVVPWDLRECDLYPGDTVFYWAFARDNWPFDSTHFSVSETFWFRVPTFEEIHEQLAGEEQAVEGALKSAQEKHKDLQTELSRLIQSTRGRQSLTWEEEQIVKDLKESVQAQSDTLTKAVESLKQTIEKMKENGLSSREITDKIDKVRKALEELARQYGDSLLFNPPRKNETIGMQDIKESLEKFRTMLPDLSKRLDNALKYLEMLKRDQRLAALAMQAEKLAEQQAALAASPGKDARAIQQQKEQDGKVDDFLSEISRSSEEGLFAKQSASALERVQSLQQSMKSSLSHNTLPSSNEMDQMSGGLFSLADNLRDLQSSAMMNKMKKEKEALLEMSHDALSMGQWQEQIASEAGRAGDRARAAHQQEALKHALSKSAGKLNSLSMTPPQILGRLMQDYDKAALSASKSLDALESGDNAAGQMAGSEEGLNALAFSLLAAAGSMDGAPGQGEGESGMMGGFQKLSGKQAMVNGATGEILRQMLGGMDGEGGEQGKDGAGTGKNELVEKAKQQAQEAQKAIADELNKLAEKYGKEAGGSMDKRARDLEEEARRLERMLENPSPELRDRQDRFLSRMLQASLSMHKQDEGKEERKSQSARNVFSLDDMKTSPAPLNDRDLFFWLRQKAFAGNFPENYRYAVKNYFDSLGVLFLKEK